MTVSALKGFSFTPSPTSWGEVPSFLLQHHAYFLSKTRHREGNPSHLRLTISLVYCVVYGICHFPVFCSPWVISGSEQNSALVCQRRIMWHNNHLISLTAFFSLFIIAYSQAHIEQQLPHKFSCGFIFFYTTVN